MITKEEVAGRRTRFYIDNNLVENAIRPLALGRKNYLFCGNHDAAIRAGIVYSLVELLPDKWAKQAN